MTKWYIFLLVDDVDQHRVPLVEGSAAAVLPTQSDRNAFESHRSEGQRLGHAVIERTLAIAHLAPLLEQLLHLGMDVEVFRIFRKRVGDALQLGSRETGVDFVGRIVRPTMKRRPVAG